MRYVPRIEHAEIWHRICWQQLNTSHGQKLVPSTRRDDRTMTGLGVLILQWYSSDSFICLVTRCQTYMEGQAWILS